MSKLSSAFSKPSTDIKQVSTLTQPQQELVGKLTEMLGPEFGMSQPVYSGPRVAGTSPLQQMSYGMGMMMPGQIQNYQNAASSALNDLQGNLGDRYQPAYDYASRMFNDVVTPQVMERFAGMDNANSGGAMQALAREGGNMSANLGAQIAPSMMQAQLAMPGAWNQTAQMGLPGMEMMNALGTQQRGIGQEGLSSVQQMWNELDPLQNRAWNLLPSILPYGQPQIENVAQQKPGGLGYSMLTGGLGQVAQLGGNALGGWLF